MPMTAEGEKLYNLSKLIEYVGDDPATIKEMVGIFLTSARELSAQMKSGCEAGSVEMTSKAAHKLKPSLDIFCIPGAATQVRLIEQAHQNALSCQSLAGLLHVFFEQLNPALSALEKDFLTH